MVRHTHQLRYTSLLGVALEDVDRVNGRCPEVPETKRGVVRGGDNKLLHGMCTDMSELSVVACQGGKRYGG